MKYDFYFLTAQPVAHRGLHGGEIPENSLSAFEEAAAKGYSVETDVQMTKDGELVLFHDDDLLRMCGVDKKVAACTYAQLCSLRLKNSQEKIPLLSDLLQRIGGRVPLLIELKHQPNAKTNVFLKKVAEELKDYRGTYALQSFHPAYVKGCKKLFPQIPCGILATAHPKKADLGGGAFWKLKAHLVKHMSLNFWSKPDFISFLFCDYPTKETEKFKGAKLAWTVRTPQEEAYARKYADNVIFEGFLPEKTVV